MHMIFLRMLPLFLAATMMATPGGLEPPASRLEGGCSIQLSYGAALFNITKRRAGFGQAVKQAKRGLLRHTLG